jgi:hypothetical protein
MHQYNVRDPFEQVAVDVAGSFGPLGKIALSAQEVLVSSMVTEALVTNLYHMSYVVTSAVTSSPV